MVHLGLLEFFRMAQFKGIRPATKTTLVACQLLLFTTQWSMQGGLPEAVASRGSCHSRVQPSAVGCCCNR